MTYSGLADIYPLSSLQQIWISNSTGPRRVEQHKHLGWQYAGILDEEALAAAWQTLVDRHEALRSAFFCQEGEAPVQLVATRAPASITFHDFEDMDAQGQEERLKYLLDSDREAGFDLSSPPLSRLLVVTNTGGLHRIVWSLEGPLVDSWSQPIVIKELFGIYEATIRGSEVFLGPPPPYRDFVAWRSGCSFAGAEQFWRRALAPFAGMTSVCDRPAGPSEPAYADQVVPVNMETFATLEAIGKARHITLNALVMGVWAIVLARYCRTDFVVFGVTLSGRSPSVPGVERMVGYFMNVLPVAVRLPADESFVAWADELQRFLLTVRQCEHLPASLPAAWCGGAGPFLFDALFVFENYPVITPGDPVVSGVDFRETQGVVVSSFPLTVLVSKGWEWLQMLYDASRVDHSTVARLLQAFDACLQEVALSPARRLRDLVRSGASSD
jgi:hypothetical protein